MTRPKRPVYQVLRERARKMGAGVVAETATDSEIAAFLDEMFRGMVPGIIDGKTVSEVTAALVTQVLATILADQSVGSRFAFEPQLYSRHDELESLLRIVTAHEERELLRHLGLGRNARDLLHYYFPHVVPVATNRPFKPDRHRDRERLRSIHVRLLWAYWVTDRFAGAANGWIAREAPESGKNRTAGGPFVSSSARYKLLWWVSQHHSDWIKGLDQDQAAALWHHAEYGRFDYREFFTGPQSWSDEYGEKGPWHWDVATRLVSDAFFGFLLTIFDEREEELSGTTEKTAMSA